MVAKLEESQGTSSSEYSGWSLSELLGQQVQKRFTGCIEVMHEGHRGRLFLRDGQVVHAEQGSAVGEGAFLAILSWPTPKLALQPDVSTTQVTVHEAWDRLGVELRRALGGRGKGRAEEPGASPNRESAAASSIERLRTVPGFTNAVVQTKDGTRVGDDSFEGEQLAGQAFYLSMVARELGDIFGTGQLQSAAVQGRLQHLLLFATKGHFLSVLAQGQSQLGALEAEVRKALSTSK